MTRQTAIDDLDSTERELVDMIEEDVRRIQREIPHPALSVKLTPAELWAKYGKDYLSMRDDPAAWQQTLDEAGEHDTLEFGSAMEKAMMKEYYGED